MGGHPADIYSVWSTRPEPGRGGLAPAPGGHRDDTEVRLKGLDPSWHRRGREDQTAITGAPTCGMDQWVEPEMMLNGAPNDYRNPRRVLTYNTGGDAAPERAPRGRRGWTSGYGTGRTPDSCNEEEDRNRRKSPTRRMSSKKRGKSDKTPIRVHEVSTSRRSSTAQHGSVQREEKSDPWDWRCPSPDPPEHRRHRHESSDSRH